MAKKTPLMNLTIDMAPLAQMAGAIKEYSSAISTPVKKRHLTSVVHGKFAEEFDKHMSFVAGVRKHNFHHVYETAIHGDPYRLVGDPKSKLWVHSKRYVSDGAWMVNFKFLPAKHRIPTYRQRRNSTVGTDPLRQVSETDFEKLLEKTKNKRYTFIWKAAMLEYNIPRRVSPRYAKWLFLPGKGFKSSMKNSDPGWRFAQSATVNQEPPGNAAGMFTTQWVKFWSSISQDEFDREVGRVAAAALKDPIQKELGNIAVSSRRRPVKLMAPQDFNAAYNQGKALGRHAANMYQERLYSMNAGSDWIFGDDGDIYGK